MGAPPPASPLEGRVSPGDLFLAWFRSGGFAFGGGTVALESLRREIVDRRGWTTEEQFSRDWALCQAAPGINLLGMAAIQGRVLGGPKGVVAAMLGMVLPSVAITAALAAGFATLRSHPSVEAAMRGIVPATAGLGLASVYRTGRPLVRKGWQRAGIMRATAVALPLLGFGGAARGSSARRPVGRRSGGRSTRRMAGAVSPFALFWTVLKSSFLSTGGMGNVPIVHADVVATSLATERQFTSSLAIGQLSPGPTGLWVVALGYALGGVWGALATAVAVTLPPLLALGVAALYRRADEHPGVEGLVWGLGLTVAGVSGGTMLVLVRSEGLRLGSVGIAGIALLLGLHGRLPTSLVLVAGAIAGLFLR